MNIMLYSKVKLLMYAKYFNFEGFVFALDQFLPQSRKKTHPVIQAKKFLFLLFICFTKSIYRSVVPFS